MEDLRKQRPSAIGKRRAAEAGMNFFSEGRAADYRPTFEDERLEPRLSKIACDYQAVVAGSDDDNWFHVSGFKSHVL